MPDREKVMTWLEICGKDRDCSGCCPYSENGFGEYGQCRESLMADAYDLLKAQEAVEPIPYHRSDGTIFKYECRKCRTKIFKMDLFCRHCGQAMKWE